VICYRRADYGTPLRTVAASEPARYNAGDEAEPTQYLALHPLGPFAELMRGNDLRTAEQVRAVRTRTWALDAPLDGFPEVTFESADDFGITAEELVGDDHSACRRLARRLRNETPGLIVPSAALPGTRNVVLFGPRVAAPYLTEPVSTIDVSASITSQAGRPPVSLLDIVRFKGQPDPALEAWKGGETFVFAEPDWSLTREHALP
jgi:RES domain